LASLERKSTFYCDEKSRDRRRNFGRGGAFRVPEGRVAMRAPGKLLATGFLAGLLAVPSPALAWRPHRPYQHHGHGHSYRYGSYHGGSSDDVALGVLGGIVGGIVLGQILAPPAPRYFPPPPPPWDPYNAGYQSGYESGLQRGRYERYQEGRQRGYDDGVSAGRSGSPYSY